MRLDVAQLDLSIRRRSLLWYAGGLSLYTLIVVAIYPALKNSASLDSIATTDPTAAALFGITGSITSPVGWLNANIYANFFPLVMLFLTVGYGAAAMAGQDEDGTLCLVAVLPLRRRAIALQKAGVMLLQASVLAAGVAALVIVGRSFDVDVPASTVISVSVAVALMGVDLGLVAMAVGARTGKRGTAIGVGSAIAAVSYLISSLAPVASWIKPARYVSLFYWSVGNDQLAKGVRPADWGVLIVVGLCAAYAVIIAFRYLDLR